MSQLNDAINAAIPDSGSQNQINDKLLRYYKANGATSNDLNDAAYQFLVAQGEAPTHLNDMWEHFLRVTMGYSGSLDDMKLKYWEDGGGGGGSAPVAGFSGTPVIGASPLAVTFTDESLNVPTSWHWEKNDGGGWVDFDGTPTAQNPVESFAAGTWSVRLTATNAHGSDDHEETDYIDTAAAPVAAFSGTPLSGAQPLAVTFTDSSTGSPTSWLWEKNDGGGWVNFSGTPNAQNPVETFATGTWSVRLTATNAYGSDGETKNNYVESLPAFSSATGGTVTTDGDYKVHTFTASGDFTFTRGVDDDVWYLVIAGGGGGSLGGGGAGGYRTNGGYTMALTSGVYPVVVGAGGAIAQKGSDSSFNGITSAGGGSGGDFDDGATGAGEAGGSGGGGGSNSTSPFTGRAGGAGDTPDTTPDQGKNGGTGGTGAGGGGGGGATAVGGNASGGNVGGNGGAGTSSSITGAAVTRAGGGGGAGFTTRGTGGAGGGGAGAQGSTLAAVAGTANTGGGGGGGAQLTPAAGGSGVVIVRYKFQ